MGVSYRIYFVGVLNIGEKLNKSPIAKIKSSPINLPVRYIVKHYINKTEKNKEVAAKKRANTSGVGKRNNYCEDIYIQ